MSLEFNTHSVSISFPELGEHGAEMENAASVTDPGYSLYVPGHSKPFDPRAAADAQESMKAKLNAISKKLVEQVSLSRNTETVS